MAILVASGVPCLAILLWAHERSRSSPGVALHHPVCTNGGLDQPNRSQRSSSSSLSWRLLSSSDAPYIGARSTTLHRYSYSSANGQTAGSGQKPLGMVGPECRCHQNIMTYRDCYRRLFTRRHANTKPAVAPARYPDRHRSVHPPGASVRNQ